MSLVPSLLSPVPASCLLPSAYFLSNLARRVGCTIVSQVTAVLSKRVLGGVVCAALILGCCPALHAAGVVVAGNEQHLWIIRPEATGKSIHVFHRRVTDQPDSRLRPADALTGSLLPGGAVSGGGFLWLFYSDHSVQALRVIEDAMGRRQYLNDILPSLPAPLTVRSLAVTRAGAWALVRVEDPRVLEAIDNPKGLPQSWRDKQRQRSRPLTAPEPPGPEGDAPPESPPKQGTTTTPATADQPATKDAPEKDAPQAPAVKADRLLHLATDAWVVVDLPNDWSPDTPAWLVTASYDQPRPLLVTGPPSEKLIRWYRWDRAGQDEKAPQEWIAAQQTLSDPLRMAPLAVRQQLVVAKRVNAPGKIEMHLTTVRPERVADMGTLSLPEASQWALTTYGERIALLTVASDGGLLINRIDLRGVADANPMPLTVEPRSLGQVADLVVFIVVLALATPVLILMWKRESGPVLAQLPATLRIADMGPRGLAALIDLVPGFVTAMLITGASVEEVLTFWPGRSGGWEAMIPGTIVIGVFVGHTFLSELFTARTIGKAITGLRVTGLRGQPPDLWRVLARNVFKVLDLIALPLLIFAIISPNKQRLGDVVARTLVVRKATSDDPAPPRRRGESDEKTDHADDREEVPDHRPSRKE